jgi:GT2 family glycosyltransferase
MSRPSLSVVVSTLGNHSGLRRVLDGYAAQRERSDDFELLVVSDVAEPDPDAVAKAVGNRRFPVTRLPGSRPGLSSNRNAGWKAARAPVVLFTDNDTVPCPILVAEHLSWHESNPEPTVAVLGHVRWARELRVSGFMKWLDRGIQFDYPSIEGVDAGWGRFYGANVSVKRELVERVGGFDEERLPYLYEDLDFGYRASKVGMRLLYNRAAEVEHLRYMDLDFWRSKVHRAAETERAFTRIHPEIPPYFHEKFSSAAALPAAKGRGRHLIRWIPPSFPWLGPKAWASADLYYRQQLAPEFLAAWQECSDPDAGADHPIAPYLLEADSTSSGGSPPGGPK